MGGAIFAISLGGCFAAMCKSKKLRHTVTKKLMLAVYCGLLVLSLLINVAASFALLNYGNNLDTANQLDFNAAKYTPFVENSQDRMHADVSEMYGSFDCYTGSNRTVGGERDAHIYKTSMGGVVAASGVDVSSVSLNVSCAASDGVWFEHFITDNCQFPGTASKYETAYDECALRYMGEVAGAADADKLAVQEGTEAYCICRASISKQLAVYAKSIGVLSAITCLVQLVLVVGCIRLLLGCAKKQPTKKEQVEQQKKIKAAMEGNLEEEDQEEEDGDGDLAKKRSSKTVSKSSRNHIKTVV
jgi:hypothetical protein